MLGTWPTSSRQAQARAGAGEGAGAGAGVSCQLHCARAGRSHPLACPAPCPGPCSTHRQSDRAGRAGRARRRETKATATPTITHFYHWIVFNQIFFFLSNTILPVSQYYLPVSNSLILLQFKPFSSLAERNLMLYLPMRRWNWCEPACLLRSGPHSRLHCTAARLFPALAAVFPCRTESRARSGPEPGGRCRKQHRT